MHQKIDCQLLMMIVPGRRLPNSCLLYAQLFISIVLSRNRSNRTHKIYCVAVGVGCLAVLACKVVVPLFDERQEE